MALPEVHPLQLGVINTPDWHPLPGRAIPIWGFLVLHDGGPIVVDNGVGSGNEFIEQQYRPELVSFEKRLAEHGVVPSDVVAVVNSHLHFDHCGSNLLFPGTPIIAQRAEYEATLEDRYTIADWVHFEGARYRQIEGDLELADGVTVLLTPGHAPGHQSVLVETERGREVLVGQAAEDHEDYRNRLGEDSSLQRIAELDPQWLHFGHDDSVDLAAG